MVELHREIATVFGSDPDVSWVEGDRLCSITGSVELFEGQRLAYIAGVCEDTTCVRVDLDRQGWVDLRALCDQMITRIDNAASAETQHP